MKYRSLVAFALGIGGICCCSIGANAAGLVGEDGYLCLGGAAAVQANNVFGAGQLQADLNGDGKVERVELTPYKSGGETYYRISVFGGGGALLWESTKSSPDAKYTAGAVTSLLFDINGDGRAELVLGGSGSLSQGRKGANSVFVWKNGQLCHSQDIWLVRSANDTTIYEMTSDAAKVGEKLSDGKGRPVKVTLGNLRVSGKELYGDILLNGDLTGSDIPEQYYGIARLKPGKDIVQAVDYKSAEQTITGEKFAWFAGSSGIEGRIIAIPETFDLALKSDLNGDGKTETVRFVQYYPGTYHYPRYQIVVDGDSKCLWKSPRLLAKGDRDVEGGTGLGGYERLGRGKGGMSTYPGSAEYPDCALVDIDGDGYIELIADGSNRCGSRFEVWRWQDGQFKFVRIAKLLQSADDASVYTWVDDPRPAGVYSNREFLSDEALKQMHIAFKKTEGGREFQCLNDMLPKDGQLWFSVGDDGGRCLAEVRLEPVPGGLKVVEKRKI